ncbi:MAG: hypothetical protein ACREIA_07280 [Opitutaceae bacterium]
MFTTAVTATVTYISPAREFVSAQRLRAIDWAADTPPGTSVHIQVRSAASADALSRSTWEGGNGKDSAFEVPTPSAGLALQGPWVQFRVLLANPGGGLPVMRSVTLDFE